MSIHPIKRVIHQAGVFICASLVVALYVEAALATDRYFCDCALGADPECIAGSDSAAGTVNDPWQSYQQARATFPLLAPGDALRFCRGGYWQISGGSTWVNNACTAAQPCVVGAYDPPWASGDEARPVLARTDMNDAFSLDNPGDAISQQGYRFEDLHLLGTDGVGSTGSYTAVAFFLFNDIDDVTIERVRIEDFAIGVNLAGANPCSSTDPSCDGRNERIVLSHSEVINNSDQGWLGASTGTRLVNNTFDGNGTASIFHHNVYIASEVETYDVQVIGNVLRNNALDSNGSCIATSLGGHGRHTDLLIEGNLVEEDPGTALPGCWGIVIDPAYLSPEQFTRLVIRGNTVRNVGNLSIGTASCVDCIIENNEIIQTNRLGGSGIAVPNRELGTGDAIGTGLTVRNNSIAYAGGGTAIQVSNTGTGHVVVSNAIQTLGDGTAFACLDTNLPAADFAAMDYNLCDSAANGFWMAGVGDLSTWQATSGLDTHSTVEDPLFTDAPGGNLSSASAASPMINTGSPGNSSATAIDGDLRDSAPDRGAHEWRRDLIFANGFEAATPTS